MVHLAKPDDRVKIIAYDEEIEGVFARYWGHREDTGGWVIRLDNGHEEWIAIRDIEKCEILQSGM